MKTVVNCVTLNGKGYSSFKLVYFVKMILKYRHRKRQFSVDLWEMPSEFAFIFKIWRKKMHCVNFSSALLYPLKWNQLFFSFWLKHKKMKSQKCVWMTFSTHLRSVGKSYFDACFWLTFCQFHLLSNTRHSRALHHAAEVNGTHSSLLQYVIYT